MNRLLLIIFFLILAFAFSSCFSDPTEKKIKRAADTLTINERAAVFFYPDSSDAEELIAELGEKDFVTTANDHLVFMDKAKNYAEAVRLKIMYAKEKKFLRFVYEDKTDSIVNLKDLLLPWGIYFFDRRKRPREIDITIFNLEYQKYFN